MSNNSINPLFVSALDILTGALGVFIVLNFLNTRALPTPPEKEPLAEAQKPGREKPEKTAAPPPKYTNPGRYNTPPRPETPAPITPEVQPKPAQPEPTPTPRPQTDNQPPAPPQDPVAVDLLKSTKGTAVLLLQQADQAKASVEFMIRQGSRTWKPSRASKYQDETFAYEKRLNYFYQTQLQPGTYEVLVRVKRGAKGTRQVFGLFGKIIPPGQTARSFNFGTFSVGNDQRDWVKAGTFTITTGGLNFQSQLPTATPENAATNPAPPTSNPAPATTPATKPNKGKSGKWG